MALDVEDGTAKSTSESYISVADADTYHTNRNPDSAWLNLGTTEKEAALRRATDFMVQRYRQRWKGMRVKLAQALDWPRAGAQLEDFYEPQFDPRPSYFSGLAYLIPEDVVPVEVQRACAELALRSVDSALAPADLAPDIDRLTIREQVGPISVEYDRAAAPTKRYQAVDMMLAPLLKPSGAMHQLQRV